MSTRDSFRTMASAGGAWSLQRALCRSLCVFVDVHQAEVPSVLYSFFALFAILASYFLLLPLREDAGISLGTSNLPTLFACSLLVTLLFTPAASAFLSRRHPHCRERALKQFYTFMASVLLVFYVMYSFSSLVLFMETAGLNQRQHTKQGLEQDQPQHSRHVLSHQGTPATTASISITAGAAGAGNSRQGFFTLDLQQVEGSGSSGSSSNAAGRVFRAHGASSKIASAARVHTVMGAFKPCSKAICHHKGAPTADITTAAFRRLQQLHQDLSSSGRSAPSPVGASGNHLLRNNSGSDIAAAGNSSMISSGSTGVNSGRRRRLSSRDGDSSLSGSQRLLHGAFYVWVNVMNLVGISSLWARCADAFTREAGARLFGFISAGATLGQLAGSLMAMMVAWTTELGAAQAHASSSSSSPGTSGGSSSNPGAADPSAPAAVLLLGAAVLQLLAAQLIVRVRPLAASATTAAGTVASTNSARGSWEGRGMEKRATLQVKRRLSDAEQGAVNAVQVAISMTASGGSSTSSSGMILAGNFSGHGGAGSNNNSSSNVPQGSKQLRNVLSGFRLILRSRYLLMLCGNLLLTYVVGSLMYFQRALVVSLSVKGPSYRTAFFAALNTWSAVCILLMQLFATSSLLKHLGMHLALGLGPLICLAGIVCVSRAPSPAVVAVFEVVRKVFGYAVYRPSREVLFTVVSRDEKYSAKLVIDTVVQRMGDAVAAAAFEVIDVWLGLGQAGVGAAGCIMCCLWLATAYKLGQHYKRLASADAAHRQQATLCQ